MVNLENWIIENKPEWIGLQNDVKSLLEIALASEKKVRNGFFGYPTLKLDEVGSFYQKCIYFKRKEVKINDDIVYKYLFAIENCAGMEVMGGNFHFECFGSTLENAIKNSGLDLDSPQPMPIILLYHGRKVYDEKEYHAFDIVSIVNQQEETLSSEELEIIKNSPKKSKK